MAGNQVQMLELNATKVGAILQAWYLRGDKLELNRIDSILRRVVENGFEGMTDVSRVQLVNCLIGVIDEVRGEEEERYRRKEEI